MSDREIRSAIAAGALDAAGLAARCGAGSRCGGCQPMVEAILHEASVLIRSAAA